MSERLEQLLDGWRDKPATRWAAAVASGLLYVPTLAFFAWIRGSADMSAIVAVSLLLLVLHGWVCAGIVLRWPVAHVVAQWDAGIGVVICVILLLKWRAAPGPDDLHPALVAALLALILTQLGLVTVSKPAPQAPAGVPGRRRKTDPLEWTRDNSEAIVVAFLMALIIRCFCLEVFKIPTGSMEPTLYGDTKPTDDPPHHVGDRIMVDKVGLILGDVRRYDVCVFRYPLDRSRNFIKRIVGLPNEDLLIHNGDIWVRPHGSGAPFRVARKPLRDQDGIWLNVWPGEDRSAATARKKWTGAPEACYLDGNAFDSAPAKGDASFKFVPPIDGRYKIFGRNQRVNDLRLRFRATFAGGGEAYVLHQRGDGYGDFEVKIRPDGTVSIEYRKQEGYDAGAPPPPAGGDPIAPGETIEVAHFDGALRVLVGGRERLAWEYLDALPDAHSGDQPAHQMEFGSRGGAVRFEDVTLGRDLDYHVKGDMSVDMKDGIEIPAGKYLAIGDNVGNSKDGRLWRTRTVKLTDGREIEGDFDAQDHFPNDRPNGDEPETIRRFRDLNGTDHYFRNDQIADRGDDDPKWHPFVSREELVGRALVVWWPLPRFKVIR